MSGSEGETEGSEKPQEEVERWNWTKRDAARLVLSAWAVISVAVVLTLMILMILETLEGPGAAGLLGVAVISASVAVRGENLVGCIAKGVLQMVGDLWRRFHQMLASVWRLAFRSLPWLAEQLGRLLFLTVSALSIRLAVLLLDRDENANGTQAAALLAVGLVSLLLAIGGPKFIRRIAKLGPSGIELAPEEREHIEEVLKAVGDPPDAPPFLKSSAQPLNGEERWYYEVSTDLILDLQHRGLDPAHLSGRDLYGYRRLIRWTAAAAIRDDEPLKAIKLLEKLRFVRELSPEEHLYLGAAYLILVEAKPDYVDLDQYLNLAKENLEKSAKEDPINPITHYLLGYVYDEVGFFDFAIQANGKAIEIDETYAPRAYWNMAVSHVKLGNKRAALDDLEKVKAGPWWKELCADPELAPLKEENDSYAAEMDKLCYERSKNSG